MNIARGTGLLYLRRVCSHSPCSNANYYCLVQNLSTKASSNDPLKYNHHKRDQTCGSSELKRLQNESHMWFGSSPLSYNNGSNSPGSDEPKPRRSPTPDLMDFPWVTRPSLLHTIRNWFFATFVIKPYFDADFTFTAFREGAKQALVSVSEDLANGDLNKLSDRVTSDCISELTKTVEKLSLKQKQELRVVQSEIVFSFPYQLGIIVDNGGTEDERTFVEITMCYHIFRGIEEYVKEKEKNLRENNPNQLMFMDMSNKEQYVSVANYRFIREITKGVDDDWTINIINHFKPDEHHRQ